MPVAEANPMIGSRSGDGRRPAGFEHGRNWFDRDRFEPVWRVGFVPNGLSGAVCTRNIIAARGLKSRRRRCHRATQAISGSHQFRETRDKLIERLEQQTDAGAVNVNEMVRLYSREYDQPILTLMEDMQTQATVYYNVFEDLKKGSVSEDSAAVRLNSEFRQVSQSLFSPS